MIQEPLTLYKLIVLYMLNRVEFPLTRTQIGDFLLGRDYTNFITLQQVFDELIEADMVIPNTIRNRTQLLMTKDGEQALRFFESRINDNIKKEIDEYLTENRLPFRNETSIQADYYKSTSGEYEARLLLREKEITLLDLTLSVPTESIASDLCDNWMKKHDDIYQYLTKELF